jgi:hypothetical protein
MVPIRRLRSGAHGHAETMGATERKEREAQTPQLAFGASDEPAGSPRIVVHVNFGVFAGREATPAEIDRLAGWLLDRVGHVTIVSEVRHEIDVHSEAAVHQVRIEVPPEDTEESPERLEPWLVDRAELWARTCIAERTPETV